MDWMTRPPPHRHSVTCVSPACDVAVGGCLLGPLPPERQAGGQHVAAEPGALPVRALQPDQGDVVVTAVRPVGPVNDNLLDSDFLLKLLGHQRVVVPHPDGVAPRAVPVPETQELVSLSDAERWSWPE